MPVTGTLVDAVAFARATLNFGQQQVGQTAGRGFLMENPNPVPVTVRSLRIEGDASFTVTNVPGVLGPGAGVVPRVTFAPTSTGENAPAVVADVGGTLLRMAVMGDGVPPPSPAMSFAPARLQWGTIARGDTRQMCTVIHSTGLGELTVATPTVAGDPAFQLVAGNAGPLPPGGMREVCVQLTAGAAGTQHLGELRVVTGAGTAVVPLSGRSY